MTCSVPELVETGSGLGILLPELLLGLLGHTGGAFSTEVQSGCGDTSTLPPRLSPAIDWITSAEREQLNGLVRLGYLFAQLENFVEAATTTTTGSVYRAALANGIDELLDVYRTSVLNIEERLLRPPLPPLLALRHFLADFEVLLPDVVGLLHEVLQNDMKAAGIMALLGKRTRCGNPLVQSCAIRLLWHCHRVLLKHLEAWMFHGEIVDPGNDFFIRKTSHVDQTDGTTSLSSSFSADLVASYSYYVAENELPPGLSIATAEAVLFIGRSVRIIRDSFSSSQWYSPSKPRDAILKLAQTFWALGREAPLQPAALRNCIETIHASIGKILWDLIRRQGDYDGLLTTTRSYFLLERGDVFQQFLRDTVRLFAEAPSVNTSAEAGIALSQAVAMFNEADGDQSFQCCALRWFDSEVPVTELPIWHPSKDPHIHIPRYDAWDGLCMEFSPPWPMQMMFGPQVLRNYCAMWQFIFRLKRVQLGLEMAWGSLAAAARGRPNNHSLGRVPTNSCSRLLLIHLGQLRHRMAHFISNLTSYVQVDVAHTATGSLRSQTAASTDFSQADAAHREFVASLVKSSCLDVPQLMAAVESIFGLCQRLCVMAQEVEAAGVDGNVAPVLSAVEDLRWKFALKHNLVYQLLQSNKLQSGAIAAGIRQLVLRLNFNGFCEADALHHAAAPRSTPSPDL